MDDPAFAVKTPASDELSAGITTIEVKRPGSPGGGEGSGRTAPHRLPADDQPRSQRPPHLAVGVQQRGSGGYACRWIARTGLGPLADDHRDVVHLFFVVCEKSRIAAYTRSTISRAGSRRCSRRTSSSRPAPNSSPSGDSLSRTPSVTRTATSPSPRANSCSAHCGSSGKSPRGKTDRFQFGRDLAGAIDNIPTRMSQS